MNNSTVNTNVYMLITESNSIICTTFGGILYIEFSLLFLLSISWSFYLLIQIIRDTKKLKNELKTSKHQFQMENKLKNFISNRVKKILLIIICMSECALMVSIFLYQIGKFQIISQGKPENRSLVSFHQFHIEERYLNSLTNNVIHVSVVITSSAICSNFLFIRILIQYLIHQYSYYKSPLKMKRKLISAVSLLLILSILGLIRPLILIQYTLTVLMLIYEFIFIAILTKNLSKLLKQRFNDALLHEYQHHHIILYYRIAYTDFKNFSVVLLLAFFFQVIAYTINFIHPIIMILVTQPDVELNVLFTIPKTSMTIHHNFSYQYDSVISLIGSIFLFIGYTLLLAPYSAVSLIRLYRYITKQRTYTSIQKSKIKKLLLNNHDAYLLYH